MAIGIEIAGREVVAVAASGTRRAPKVAGRWRGTLPAAPTEANAEENGRWLREQLKGAGVKGKACAVVLGRGGVSWTAAKVPPAPDDELPAIVRFAVEDVRHAPLDDDVLDYQRRPDRAGEASVSAVSLPGDEVRAIAALCEAAGLKADVLSLRPYAVQPLLDDVDDGHAHLLATWGIGTVELSVWHGPALLYYRAAPLGDDGAGRVVGEIRRTLAAFYAAAPGEELSQATLCGHVAPDLVEAVAAATGVPVRTVDLLGGDAADAETDVEDNAYIGAAAAAIAHGGGGAWPVNLLDPKKPVVKREGNRLSLVLAGVLAAVVLGGLSWYASNELESLDQQIEAQEAQLAQFTDNTEILAPELEKHDEVAQWLAADVDWLPELHDLARSLPDTSEAFLTSIKATAGDGRKPPTIEVQGEAVSDSVVTLMQWQWAADGGHYVLDKATGLVRTEKQEGFPWTFNLALGLTPLDPEALSGRTADFGKALASSVPEGQKRVDLPLGPRPADKKATRSSAKRSSSGSASSGGSAESEAASAPKDTLLEDVIAMSPEDREEKILSMPKPVQKLFRLKLEKALEERK